MGKSIKAGKKKKARYDMSEYKGLTQADLRRAERTLNREIEQSKQEATLAATKTVQALVFYGMYRLECGLDEIRTVWNAINDVSEDINGGRLTFPQLYEELEQIGVVLER